MRVKAMSSSCFFVFFFSSRRRHTRLQGDWSSDVCSSDLPPSTVVHVMPTGQPQPPRYNDLSQLSYRETAAAAQRIERAYDASLAYLDGEIGRASCRERV